MHCLVPTPDQPVYHACWNNDAALPCYRTSTGERPAASSLFVQLQHHIWHLDVLFRLILHRHFEYHVLLVFRYRFPADRLHQFAQSGQILVHPRYTIVRIFTYLRPILSLSLLGG